MTRTTLRDARAFERPLVTPRALDALSARLIERAGFRAYTVGGSALLASRHALPDLGLIGLTDMAGGLRDIAAATTLPFFADGDDGYGDVKAVVRMVGERGHQRALGSQGVAQGRTDHGAGRRPGQRRRRVKAGTVPGTRPAR